MRTAALFVSAMNGLAKAGALGPVRPVRWTRMLRAAGGLGPTPAAAGAVAAARDPSGVAVIDDWGSMTYGALEERAAALAVGLRPYVLAGERVGILCRNHRGFVEALLGATRLGVDVVLLNTEFSAPRLGSALASQRVGLVLYDEEFAESLDASGYSGPRLPCVDGRFDAPSLSLSPSPGSRAFRKRRGGRLIVLTSGTTGTPKGAIRRVSISGVLAPVVAHLRTMPLRSGEPMLVAPPLFHGFGLVYLGGALVLGTPLVLCRRFSAAAVLELVRAHRVRSLFVVPVMLRRLLAAVSASASSYDVSSLRVVGCGAAPLSPGLASEALDAFGDVLYNLYGSVEAGWGTVAGPADLRAAPGTVGRAPRGVVLRVLDESGAVVPSGVVGRVCVGGGLAFEGYTDGDGAGRLVGGGLVDTGDLGHLDASGRLFIDGRADDMIVSGGENVFPQVVEDCLAGHPEVLEAAVFGVPDEEFGQRLVAHVVRASGGAVTEGELLAYVRDRVARFEVPREVVFVAELPRTATGKIRRSGLR
jgi:acyl-CoA synthetase (AMP-forming)/AMP-acid ligase II